MKEFAPTYMQPLWTSGACGRRERKIGPDTTEPWKVKVVICDWEALRGDVLGNSWLQQA